MCSTKGIISMCSLSKIFIVLCLTFMPVSALAVTFEWDRNTEIDMAHYEVYFCSTSSSCIPSVDAASRLGVNIPQPVIGIKPTMLVPVGKEGRAAVLAVDLVGNKSGLSNIVPFDGLAPASPLNLLTK